MILFKQALRGLWRGKRSYAACILLIALGVASYVGFTQSGQQLLATMNSLYATQNFGDAFAEVKGISQGGVAALENLQGIERASGTATADVRVLSGGEDQLSLHLISRDESAPAPLDQFLLLAGSFPQQGEIAVSRLFFEAQGLAISQEIELSYKGQLIRSSISGIVGGPGYIAELGDPATSGYACMPAEAIQTLTGNTRLYNTLSFRLSPGTTFEQVEPALGEALARYGLQSLVARKDHAGHYAAHDSFTQLTDIGGMLAGLFLGVAVLVLYILLRRVIEQDRTQIGTMKAFGIGPGRILSLYIGYGMLTALVGCLLGMALGIGIAQYFTAIYLTILQMPAIPYAHDLTVLATALAQSLLAGVFGAVMGARAVMDLSPAEAMRPAAPPPIKKKSRQRQSILPLPVSMALRSLSRAKFRSGFIAGGLAVSFAILTFMSSYASIMDDIMMTQFSKIQHYDIKLSLSQPLSYTAAIQSASGLNGVSGAEGLLEVPVTFRNGHLKKEGTAIGMEQGATLQRMYDSLQEVYIAVPQNGAVISQSLADRLEAGVGDTLLMTTDYTGDDELPVTVSGIIGVNEGPTAYVELGRLCGILGTDSAVNAVLLQTADLSGVKAQLSDAGQVSAVIDKAATQQLMQNDLDASLGINVGLFAVMGLGVAFAIIASTASIALSERSREYATLRVLGLSPGDVGKTLLLEYCILSLIAILPGLPMAYGMRWFMLTAMSDDTLSLSMHIALIHFLVGGAVSLLVVLLANISSIRSIARLEMTDILKERE